MATPAPPLLPHLKEISIREIKEPTQNSLYYHDTTAQVSATTSALFVFPSFPNFYIVLCFLFSATQLSWRDLRQVQEIEISVETRLRRYGAMVVLVFLVVFLVVSHGLQGCILVAFVTESSGLLKLLVVIWMSIEGIELCWGTLLLGILLVLLSLGLTLTSFLLQTLTLTLILSTSHHIVMLLLPRLAPTHSHPCFLLSKVSLLLPHLRHLQWKLCKVLGQWSPSLGLGSSRVSLTWILRCMLLTLTMIWI